MVLSMSAKSFFKKGDLLVYALILALVVLLFLFFGKTNSAFVTVSQNGKTLYTFDLNDKTLAGKEFVIEGKYQNKILIQNGKLFVTEANCPDRLCAQSLPLSSNGGVICCVPNGLVITVQNDKAQWDVIVQ